jgi:hypothetical protein
MTKPSDTLARLRARSAEAGRFVLALDPVWSEKLTQAYARLRQAETLDEAAAIEAAKAEVAGLEESAGDRVEVFIFRRMSRPEWEELVHAHPLTPEQQERMKTAEMWEREIWNPETFYPDMVARVCIKPKMTLEEATELLAGVNEDGQPLLSAGESRQLTNAASAAALSVATPPRELKLP